MAAINIRSAIQTSQRIIPMIYAYSTPEIHKHDGWVKIGYTEAQDVESRIKQQTHTADIEAKLEWKDNAIYSDGSGDYFQDHDFHNYLTKKGIERTNGTEWFHINGSASYSLFHEFRANRGLIQSDDGVIPYSLRKEQEEAVKQTADYYNNTYQDGYSRHGEMLWNAKPRFGKTLTVYDFCKTIGAKNVLVVTNRPAIANSWYSDYEKFLGLKSGYRFVSETSNLKGKPLVRDVVGFLRENKNKDLKRIEFLSLQDLKGSIYAGGRFNKLEHIYDIDWDVLVIDEAHEGVDTYKTDTAFENIKRKFTIHLSGTPFKALANEKFTPSAIYNWTYSDEQKAKAEWDQESENPYASLPKLNLFTYQMSEMIRDEASSGIVLNGEQTEYAFDLNEFFSTKNGKFVYEESVDRFLDMLTEGEKYPFSSPELRDELKHTFWLLNRVDSAKALAKKLKEHPVFKDYEIVLAAGDGKLSEEEESQKSFDKVRNAISNFDKTITLSVGQLTTGITIPEWSAVLMLSSMKSPALYMQAAFRSQNPYSFKKDGQQYRKENAYVFDFDPARTLGIYEKFANDLSPETADGRGTADQVKENIRTLLNFFPVIGEDANGEMIELDAEKVLSIPRKIRSAEVVKRGFMSDFLFQNIANVFHAPKEVIDIIKQFEAVDEPKAVIDIDEQTAEDLSIDENGEVNIPDNIIVGKCESVFGQKIYGIEENLSSVVEEIKTTKPAKIDDAVERLKKEFKTGAVETLINAAKEEYGKDMT
ncbi:MAG: DEAD/DEAH box helicase family protein, partial [Erysipelotrichaceae bacterium]|nr:DEAD/DEAH box helicase family protein [Erysipelotrichaceae bacterium]